ncbi:MAG: hypothetical protein ACTHMI_21695 [Mucilaginibacter sp.]|jgi:hypothetical protein|uniref:hypothetical protein n=1 Tax=Mucilaginibacter sp. L3T2-6 TaxID=3062491 RepID=UPI00267693F8|nr:hypothetical protein [Mucilaginibacter sp. L3T2-6]MDO3644245.1 hypothetical protein [Mucilaginibacter sp. L3T2-6]MDV6216658.1 hypothetical protein [Mucilaginibacter sp. L3T2-6]
MADLNKFQRSKERMVEILNYLTKTGKNDQQDDTYVLTLEQSIQIIDSKIEELRQSEITEKN